jgi:hypothetical protein
MKCTYVRNIKVIATMVTTVTVFRVNPKYLYFELSRTLNTHKLTQCPNIAALAEIYKFLKHV